MPRVLGRMYRRVVSLLLTAAVLFSCLPAQAVGMSVTLEPSDPSTVVPVGTTITFEVKGTGTAGVSLMVVPPDSRQRIVPGASHEVTFSQPGMYVIAGYGANGTDENAAGFQRCMSPFHIVQAVGEAPAEEEPTELRGTLTLEAFTAPEWVALKNAELRWNKLLMWIHLSDQSIPEGARLQVDLYLNHESRTLLECEVGQDTSWTIEGTEIAKALMAGGSGEPEYGRYAMSAAATIYTPDGQKITAAEPFVMGWYSPEMLYVNQFYNDSWTYAASDMGKRLVKWLDMSERGEGDRSSSGYLMLEQEILHRKSFLIKAGELYVIWAQKALQTVSSLGMNLAYGLVSNISYESKFGEAGKKALPYYNMLASVYQNYLTTLLTDIQDISRGAYIEEQIRKNTALITVERIAEKSDALGGAADVISGNDTFVDLMCLSAVNYDNETYCRLGSYSSAKGKKYNIEVTDVVRIPNEDGRGSKLWFSWVEDGVECYQPLDYFAGKVFNGDEFIMNTTKVTDTDLTATDLNILMADEIRATYGPTVRVTEDGLESVGVRYMGAVETYSDPYGNRKIYVDGKEYDFTPEKIRELGMVDSLSDVDRAAFDKYQQRLDSKTAIEAAQKIAGVVAYGADLVHVISNTTYHSRLQEAYFYTYSQVSAEYIHMLLNWAESLEDSNEEDAEYIRAAVLALAEDIYASWDQSLSNIVKAENVLMYTVAEWTELFFDTIEIVCDIPEIVAAFKNLPLIGKQIKTAATSSLQWASNMLKGLGKGAATNAGSATVNTAKAGMSAATKATLSMLVISAGSIIYDLLFGAKIGTIEAFYDVYYTKQTLKETLDETLRDYAWTPTHQQAVDIIESLYLMKELKLKGENLVISYYLTDMYKQFELDGVKEQLILMNEIVAMDSNYELNGAPNITQVYVLHENYIAGTRKDLKDQGREIDGAGFIIGGDNEHILGTRIVGVYCNPGETATYQGVELEPVPAGLKAVASKDSNRDSASHPPVSNEADWLKEEASLAPDWQNDMPTTLENSNMYVKIMYLYSNHGLDLLLTDEERKKYGTGEAAVEQLLANNNDATGDELAFWQIKEKEEWQAQQRIVWTYVTRKYIESLPMFDRAQ